MKSAMILAALLVSMGCRTQCSVKVARSINTPPLLAEYEANLKSDSRHSEAELTLKLAHRVCPGLMDDLTQCDDWHLNRLAADLNSDGTNEQILLFWESGDFHAVLCVLQQVSGEWEATYQKRLQERAYSVPTLFAVNSEGEGQYVICGFESIAHATGLHESEWEVVGMVEDRPRSVLKLLRDFHNYFAGIDVTLDSAGEGALELRIRYRYSDGPESGVRREILRGEGRARMTWDSLSGGFRPDFQADDRMSEGKFEFLMSKRSPDDKSFKDVWGDELDETQMAKGAKSAPPGSEATKIQESSNNGQSLQVTRDVNPTKMAYKTGSLAAQP